MVVRLPAATTTGHAGAVRVRGEVDAGERDLAVMPNGLVLDRGQVEVPDGSGFLLVEVDPSTD